MFPNLHYILQMRPSTSIYSGLNTPEFALFTNKKLFMGCCFVSIGTQPQCGVWLIAIAILGKVISVNTLRIANLEQKDLRPKNKRMVCTELQAIE